MAVSRLEPPRIAYPTRQYRSARILSMEISQKEVESVRVLAARAGQDAERAGLRVDQAIQLLHGVPEGLKEQVQAMIGEDVDLGTLQNESDEWQEIQKTIQQTMVEFMKANAGQFADSAAMHAAPPATPKSSPQKRAKINVGGQNRSSPGGSSSAGGGVGLPAPASLFKNIFEIQDQEYKSLSGVTVEGRLQLKCGLDEPVQGAGKKPPISTCLIKDAVDELGSDKVNVICVKIFELTPATKQKWVDQGNATPCIRIENAEVEKAWNADIGPHELTVNEFRGAKVIFIEDAEKYPLPEWTFMSFDEVTPSMTEPLVSVIGKVVEIGRVWKKNKSRRDLMISADGRRLKMTMWCSHANATYVIDETYMFISGEKSPRGGEVSINCWGATSMVVHCAGEYADLAM